MTTFEWNNYIIYKDAIGKGSFSKVYYGYHKQTRLEIALKKIVFSKLQDIIKDKVVSEINILQRLNHVNIMKLYEYKFDGDYMLLVMEYCNNKNMETFMSRSRSVHEIRNKINQITIGMEYLHTNFIIHRDIKPQNILLHNDTIKIGDFGFSILIKDYNQMMNTMCGTPLYMSPELLYCTPYTMKSEIWALGILYYTMIYNVHPFGKLYSIDEYKLKINNMISLITFPPIPELNDIIYILKKMLSYEAKNRPILTDLLHVFVKKITIKTPEHFDELDLDDVFRLEVNTIDTIDTKAYVDNSSNIPIQSQSESYQKQPRNLTQEVDYFSDDELDVTGRGKTNKGYDQVQINTDYFTPPDIHSYTKPMMIPRASSSYYSSGSGSSGTRGSFFSTSIEKFTSFFNMKSL